MIEKHSRLKGVAGKIGERHRPPERADQSDKSNESRNKSALEAAWRADADQLTHEQSEIEAGRVDQQSRPNVPVPSKVHAAHAAGLIEMRKRSFQPFAAQPEEPLTARAANAPSIAVHSVACVGVLLPIPSSPIGFGDIAAHAHGLEIYERVIAVIALVGDDLLEAIGVGPHRLDLLGGVNQRLDAGRRDRVDPFRAALSDTRLD